MSKNLISIENLQKSYSEKTICQSETFGINTDEKIGLIGINGCGKSTFLKILVGQENADFGDITFRSGMKIGYLAQIPELNPDLNIYEQIYYSDKKEFKLLREYYRIIELLVDNDDPKLHLKLHNLMREIDSVSGWKIENKAKEFLTRFGLTDYNKKTSLLSGGQKRRLDLARVLMDEPDILIMDEPTNHLDIDTIEWLQNYLIQYSGTLIFVTHDRYFLDAVSTRIMEIEEGKIRFYEGNYSYYLKKKELELVDIQRKETRRQSQLQKEMKWLLRGARARTSKPKNHVERVKELLDKSYLTNDKELDISFQSKRLGKTILELNNVSKHYESLQLFNRFSHLFQKMERIGIIGANGTGKTTLIRLIVGEEIPSDGRVKRGINTHFSYFKQNIDEFEENMSVLDYIRKYAENIRTADGTLHSASEMLKRFLFNGKMQQAKIRSLSGGERKRLYLLRSLMFGSNFIILDEPTNDLDIKTLEILEDYLDAFKGCILVVSHDRYFLDRVVDTIFIFEKDRIIKFPGNYSDYLLVKRYNEEEKLENVKSRDAQVRKKSKKKIGLNFNEKRELEQLGIEMSQLEEHLESLNQQIEKEATTLTSAEFLVISNEQQTIQTRLETIGDRWLELESIKEGQ